MAKKPAKKTKKKASSRVSKKPVGKKAKKKAAPKKKAPAAPSGGQVIHLFCSECEEPLSFNTASADETLTCPECLCAARKPDQDFVNTVNLHHKGEKTSLVLAVISLALFLVSVIGLIFVASPVNDGGEENTRMIFLGASGLFLLLSLVFLFKYEKSRWLVYF